MLAHGQFLHPDAEVLADFLHHGQGTDRQSTPCHRDQHGARRPSGAAQQDVGGRTVSGTGLPPPKPTLSFVSVSPVTVDSQSSTTATSISSATVVPFGGGPASGIPDGGGRGGGGGHGGGVEAVAGAEARAGGTVAAIAAPRRGSKGTCMVSVWLQQPEPGVVNLDTSSQSQPLRSSWYCVPT